MSRSRRQQRTITRDAEVRGVGFLTGADVHVRFRPAEAGTGVVFMRADLPDRPSIPAHVRYVVPRQRRTTLQRGAATVEMVEHVMAALAGLRIDNCVVELDAGETPGCDGSSRVFVEVLEEAGYVEQSRAREVVSIDRPVSVREGDAVLTAYPGNDEKLVLSYNLDFGKHTAIGSQSYFLDITPETFRNELADSRTFLLEAEADALKQSGVGRRTKETDLLIFGPDGPINNTLRYPDECVRHKILDMVGDLALAGVDLSGHVVAHRSGHQLNTELVRQLLDNVVEVEPQPTTPVLDIRAVMELLPHRYPILLVDRVLELEPGRRIVAIKNVTCNEPYFQGHWPGRPIMPGVLILESLAQACGLLIAQQVDPARTVGLIAGIDEVRLRRPVVPGDQLRLEVALLRWRSKMIDMRCEAWVGEQLVAEGKIRFVLAANQSESRSEAACSGTGLSGNGSGSARVHV